MWSLNLRKDLLKLLAKFSVAFILKTIGGDVIISLSFGIEGISIDIPIGEGISINIPIELLVQILIFI